MIAEQTSLLAKPAGQNAAILAALKRGEKLTPLEALNRFGCSRLAARIWDLERMGYQIHSEMIRLSTGKHVARYSLSTAQAGGASNVRPLQGDPVSDA